jgi:O-antigen ligase
MRRIGRVEGGGLWSAGVLLVLGLAIGISPFFEGLYSPQKWAPVGIVLVIAFVAGVMARPFTPSLPTSVFVIALSVLALFALLSSTWAPSPERAFIEGNRIFLYIALAGLLLVAIRDDRAATVGLVAATVGSIVVVGYLAVEMAIGDGQQLFLGGRLHEPMAYINGQGTMLLLTFFPLLALAEHARRPALAGVGAALAALVAGVALLTQSRGVALAGIAGLAVVLLAVPGRRWRIAALTVVGIGVAIAARQLFDVLPASGAPEFADVVESASRGLLVCAAAVGLVWAAVCLAARHVPEGRRARAARAWSVGLGVAAVLVVALAAANAGRIASGIGHEYDAFVKLEGSEAGPVTSRLLSGGGNRYDYWRIAVHAWEDSPLRGGGAGAYPVAYFRERTTTEDIRQPHSLGLQALSELGLVGLILVLIAGAAVAVAARRRLLALGESRARRSLLVAALGTAVAWAVHASVDWPHLIPGVTAFALIAVAVLLRPDRLQPTPEPESDPAPARPPAWRRLAPAVGLAGLLAVAGFSLSRQVLTDHYRSEAEAALEAGRPADAIEQADRALRLAPNGIDPYYSKAAAYARFNEPGAARATLEEAIRREPTNFVTYVLMGDLEVRVGRYGAARRAYRSASELNPQDVELATLAEDPTAAHEKLSP